VPVSALLRKALLVASKLGLSDIPEWINNELSGYSSGDSVPAYRVMHGVVKAKTIRGWVPVRLPTSELQRTISETNITDSVSEIEAFAKRERGSLVMNFPPEAQQALQDATQVETEFTCFLERTRFDGILGEVRNQVLRWAMALDKAGIRGDGLSFTNAEKERAHSMVFHADNGSITIGVVGDVAGQANVAAGFQPRAGSIAVDDIQKLVAEISSHINSLKLPAPEKRELLTALSELENSGTAKSIEAGKVRQVLARILAFVGKAGETVVTAGIKALAESWMKQHGISP
jgi:hypothetical protein